jgi:putative ABC transport system permease protein
MLAMLSLLRYSLRQLFKSPGFTITAIVILGFSIGMSTAIFSLIDAVILKPLPFPDSERLVQVCEPHQNHPFSVFDYPDYVDMVAAQHTFESLALKKEVTVDLRTNGEAQRLEADFVSPSLFSVTGLPTILGRVFTEGEDIPNGPLVAVLSERCWRSRFQSDPNILGKNLILSDLSFQVIGIVPSQLDDWGPPGADVYLPVHTIVPFNFLGNPFALRDTHVFYCFGRLKAGVSVSQAEAELMTIHDNLLSQFPGVNIGYGLRVLPLLGFIVHGYSMTIWLLAAAVGVLLIVSCLNVANLLFARGLHRRREMMIRATLGASRWRVIGQQLLETTLLTSIGGLVGLVVANICVQGTKSLIPADLYRLQELHVDTNALGFIFVLILITSLLAGLLPAWSLSQVTLAPGLKDEGGRTGTGGPHRHSIQSGLVTAQVALTCVLLIAAGLLIRSFYATQTAELGFNPNHLLMAGINLTSVKYERDGVKTRAFWDELITKIRRIPGVTDAALSTNPPLNGEYGFTPFIVDGEPRPEPDQEPVVDWQTVSSDYFRTLQIPLLQGRDFDSQDTTDKANVIVVDAALVNHFFPGQNPIGKSISIGGGGNFRSAPSLHYTIVGVVPHLCHDTPGEWEVPFQAYHPYTESDGDDEYLIIRSNLTSASLVATVRQTVASIDPGVPIFDVHSYDEVIAQRFVTRRLSTLLVALFSGAALFLSAVGLYGILSYFVGQKTREIGIRMALGAQAGHILRLVAEQGLWPVGVGLTTGILAGLLLARFVGAFLYGVSAYDPITLALTVLVLGIATLLACLLPAVRAIQINPTRVLNE